jgi:hypothetical protein
VSSIRHSPLNRFDVMNAVWALRGITPAAALDRLAALGIVDRGDRAAASSNVMEEDLRLRPYGVAFGAVTAHYVVALYDAEASQVPCGHDRPAFTLADFSRGAFRPDGVREEYVPPTGGGPGSYRLTFVHEGRVYRVGFHDEGDYYHPTAVAEGANRALRDAGRPEQFLPLTTSDQMAAWLFAPPDRARQASSELLLQLEDDDEPLQRTLDALTV